MGTRHPVRVYDLLHNISVSSAACMTYDGPASFRLSPPVRFHCVNVFNAWM